MSEFDSALGHKTAETRKDKVKRAEARVDRCFSAFLVGQTTLLALVWLGQWWAFAYVQGLLLLTVAFGLYALGVKKGSE